MAIGDRIFVYEAETGKLLHSLRGHAAGKSVYTVDYAKNGKRFASGGSDMFVVIWSNRCEGILKYDHTSSIQALAYNPQTDWLASVATNDFGIWNSEQSSVEKYQLSSKGLSASWSPDGLLLAIGLINGTVLIRGKSGTPNGEFSRKAPIWGLAWNPIKPEEQDCQLAVCCWDETLSFWDSTGKQLGIDKELGFLPTSVSFFSNGEFLVLSGSDRKATLWTKEGVCLGPIGEMQEWLWTAAVRPKFNSIAVGGNNATISMFDVTFSIVNAIYQDRYAYCEVMTDVIIQHLETDHKVKLKCRDLVRKISMYKDRLAVLLPEKIIIYTVTPDDELDMRYRSYQKINKKFECSLMALVYYHVVICHENQLQLVNFNGEVEREWSMDSPVNYIKVNGGLPGKEGLLIGLKSGTACKLFVDNQFPIILNKHSTGVVCADLSLHRNKLAIVDDNSNLLVYDLKTQQLIFQQHSVNSVAFNSDMEEMVSYTGAGALSIRTGSFPPSSQSMVGEVLGFRGSRIYSLNNVNVNVVNVPQSEAMYKYLEQKDLKSAFKVAFLGVTDEDWRRLAIEALQVHNFPLARKAFLKVKDLRFLELVSNIELERRSPGYNDMIMMGQVAAYQGKYNEAATLFVKGSDVRRAVDMFKELKDWERAQEFVKKLDKDQQISIIRDQAADAEASDWKVSANLFINVSDYKKAVQIIGSKGDLKWLIDICRQLSKADNTDSLIQCANFFRQYGHHAYAKEAYLKLGDLKSLLNLHIELEKWEEAFRVTKQNPELAPILYLPYAQWLISHDRFEEAKEAYKKADMMQEAHRLLLRLTVNAIEERKFGLVCVYYQKLAKEYLSQINNCMDPSPQDAKNYADFETFSKLSEIYYAYAHIHRYAESPFMLPLPNYEEMIFSAAQFLLNSLPNVCPRGINKIYVYYVLGKLAAKLGAYKTAKSAYEKLLGLKVPYEWQEEVEVSALGVKAKPFADKEELFTVCYRCMNSNSPLSPEDCCTACKHPFIRSFISFTPLPLVEFEPHSSIPPQKVAQLVKTESPFKGGRRKGQDGLGWQDSLQIKANDNDFEDAFTAKMNEWTDTQMAQQEYSPVVVDEVTLAAMPPQEIFVVDNSDLCPTYPKHYYKLMIPDIFIILCPSCKHFFLQDEYDFAFLEEEACPVCKYKPEESE